MTWRVPAKEPDAILQHVASWGDRLPHAPWSNMMSSLSSLRVLKKTSHYFIAVAVHGVIQMRFATLWLGDPHAFGDRWSRLGVAAELGDGAGAAFRRGGTI